MERGRTTDAHFDPRLLAFLRDPDSYPHHPAEIHELHTHASLVFIVPPFVYKIKKPVNFGFLDFSTLAKRRHFCEREVELNSRLAPGIYLGVETITREGGGFSFGGSGPVAECAVKMLRMPADGFMDVRIAAGTAGEAELERVAAVLADFYRKQPSPPDVAEWGTVEKLRISTDENSSQTGAFIGKTLSRGAFDAIRAFTENCYELHRHLFNQRVAAGWIRDCHGDLHLDHVHVTGDALHIYDCIEFNDRFRHLDVASDVAFLAMDLDYHQRPDLAAFFVRRVANLLGDPGMAGLMDFYKCYRAYVRGKVESLHTVAEIADDAERAEAATRARRYFQLALQYAVCGSLPVVMVFMGRVASGKSTLARAVSRELGWTLVSSDERRKTLAGVPLHQRGDAASRKALYTARMTDLTYDSLIRDADESLSAGHGLILDATFSKRSSRDRLREKLGDRKPIWILTEVDESAARERLERRDHLDNVVSDARAGDHDFLNAAFEAPDELPGNSVFAINTAGDTGETVRTLLMKMATGLR
jgi:aminoglycoside phosphotransferase family enzyme/predicted kinase